MSIKWRLIMWNMYWRYFISHRRSHRTLQSNQQMSPWLISCGVNRKHFISLKSEERKTINICCIHSVWNTISWPWSSVGIGGLRLERSEGERRGRAAIPGKAQLKDRNRDDDVGIVTAERFWLWWVLHCHSKIHNDFDISMLLEIVE